MDALYFMEVLWMIQQLPGSEDVYLVCPYRADVIEGKCEIEDKKTVWIHGAPGAIPFNRADTPLHLPRWRTRRPRRSVSPAKPWRTRTRSAWTRHDLEPGTAGLPGGSGLFPTARWLRELIG